LNWPELSAAKPKHPIDYASTLNCPYLGVFAGEDATIPAESVQELDQGLAHNAQHGIHTYPGAPHAFFNDTRPSYRAEIAKDAWARMLSFLGRHLTPRMSSAMMPLSS